MEINNINFLDSLNYLPMTLAKLPKAFELSVNIKKLHFPHLFNTRENANYIAPLPSVHFYSIDSMIENDRNEFIAWYEENKHTEFYMQSQLEDYCKNDVYILAEACIKFRKLMLEESNMCPFIEGVTIASACNLVFPRNFFKTRDNLFNTKKWL